MYLKIFEGMGNLFFYPYMAKCNKKDFRMKTST